MKALKIEPGKAPERIDIGNELEALQDAVGGYIQVLYPDQHRPVGLICNEEGKCMGLKPNRALYRGGKPYDVIVGTFLVVGVDEYARTPPHPGREFGYQPIMWPGSHVTICGKRMQRILRICSIRRRSLSTSQGGWSSPRWFLAGLNGPAFLKY